MNTENDDKIVRCIFCKCGKSVNQVTAMDYVRTPAEKAAITRESNNAKSFGIKVEDMTLAEYRKLPFMCRSVSDCPDN